MRKENSHWHSLLDTRINEARKNSRGKEYSWEGWRGSRKGDRGTLQRHFSCFETLS